jgi:hypothetical protein
MVGEGLATILVCLTAGAALTAFLSIGLRRGFLQGVFDGSPHGTEQGTRSLEALSAELYRQKQEVDAVLDCAPAPIILLDEQARALRANRAAEKLADCEAGGLLGLHAGKAIRCANAATGDGCGFHAQCTCCSIRSAVTATLHTGERISSPHRVGAVEEQGRA